MAVLACTEGEEIVLGRVGGGEGEPDAAVGGASPHVGSFGGASGVEEENPTPENLLLNGDFSQGTLGFQTSYAIVESEPLPAGELAVTEESSALHSELNEDVADVSGEGFVLMVNGASEANLPVYEQAFPVEEGARYRFSIWMRLWWSNPDQSPPRLELSLDGTKVSDLTEGVLLSGESWTELSFEWNAGSTGLTELSLVNSHLEVMLNDFYLDAVAVHAIPQ